MDVTTSRLAHLDNTNWLIVTIGIIALAVAMGIGRFAFTPLMPLMLRDATLTLVSSAEWAAANYFGYLIGALSAAWFSKNPRCGLKVALIGVTLATLAVAAIGQASPPHIGALLRCAAGLFSAWTLISTSGWALVELARRQAPQLGAWIYVGVGLGIALAGSLAWLGGAQPARWLWLEMGLFAAVAALFIFLRLHEAGTVTDSPAVALPRAAAQSQLPLVLCYGTFGFGYIVPATFLPAMARQKVDDPLVFGLIWPLFGLAAAISVMVAARFLSAWPRSRVWALAQGTMAIGTAMPLAMPSLWGLTISAVLIGGTFMVVTMAGMQLARERLPANPTSLLARMTAAFAAGQIMGPLLVRALSPVRFAGWGALEWASLAATVSLLVSAAWLWRLNHHDHHDRHNIP